MVKKKLTIEDLASMMSRGFHDVEKRLMGEIANQVGGLRKDMLEALDRMNADIRDIKIVQGPMIRASAAHEHSIRDLTLRLQRVERKLGIRSDRVDACRLRHSIPPCLGE